jgi:hypothetical protein
MSDLLESTKALVEIAKSGAAVPPVPHSAIQCMKWCISEIESLRRSVERKQLQHERSQRYWVDAATKALAGDTEHLRLRVDMALSGPIEMTDQR